MTYTAAYGDVDKSPTEPTESRTFDTREEAQFWLDDVIKDLPEANMWEEEIIHSEDHIEIRVNQECSWHAWISNDEKDE